MNAKLLKLHEEIRELRQAGRSVEAVKIAEKTFKEAAGKEEIQLAYSCLLLLQNRYMLFGEKRKYEKVSKLIDEYFRKIDAERVCQHAYTRFKLNHAKSVNQGNEFIVLANDAIKRMLPNLLTTRCRFYYYSVLVGRSEAIMIHENTIRDCREAYTIFENHPFYVYKFTFIFKSIPPLIMLGDFAEAKRSIDWALSLCPSKNYNYCATLLTKCLHDFHSGNYASAFETVDLAKKTDLIPENLQEQWLIVEAYCYFLKKCGALPINRRFRIGKFLNQINHYIHDKAGNNYNVVLVNLLHMLANGRHDDFIDSIDAVKVYSWRYLKKSRAKTFINYLIQLPKYRFKRSAVKYNIKPKFGRIESLGNELFPYPVLWKLVLDLLD